MEQKQLPAMLMLIGGELLNLLIERKKLTYENAVKIFYTSKLYQTLEDEKSKLWHLSCETLYVLLCEELGTGKITYPEEQ